MFTILRPVSHKLTPISFGIKPRPRTRDCDENLPTPELLAGSVSTADNCNYNTHSYIRNYKLECIDDNPDCAAWANHGHCLPDTYVYIHCQVSCNRCNVRRSEQTVHRRQENHVEEKSEPAKEVTKSCRDDDNGCRGWAASGTCQQSTYVRNHCRFSCGLCTAFSTATADLAKYDVHLLSEELKPLGFLLGKWREEFRGKAVFPTMPVFSYGEEMDFRIAENSLHGFPALNYSAHAWGLNTQEELHSENGFLTARNWKGSLATVMSNGFTVVEEATLDNSNSVRFRAKDIDRITFSRDLPVNDMRREWVLLPSGQHLQQTLSMSTLTHPMQLHTRIIYRKIFP